MPHSGFRTMAGSVAKESIRKCIAGFIILIFKAMLSLVYLQKSAVQQMHLLRDCFVIRKKKTMTTKNMSFKNQLTSRHIKGGQWYIACIGEIPLTDILHPHTEKLLNLPLCSYWLSPRTEIKEVVFRQQLFFTVGKGKWIWGLSK